VAWKLTEGATGTCATELTLPRQSNPQPREVCLPPAGFHLWRGFLFYECSNYRCVWRRRKQHGDAC